MKKIISLVLSALLIISAMTVLPAGYAETREMTSAYAKGSNQELLDMLNKLDPQQFSDYSRLNLTEEQFSEIKEQTDVIIAESAAKTDYESLKAIASWVSKNIQYDYDLTGGSQDAYNVFIKRLGICHGFSNLTAAMCAAADIPCIVVNGDSSAGGHAWSMAYAGGRWIFLDTTWGDSWFDTDIDTFSEHHKPYYSNDIRVQQGDFIFTYFNGVAPCQYIGQGNDWVIPSSAFDMPVTGVSIELFNDYDCPIETLYIPETVKNMEYSSLVYCSNLREIQTAENNQFFASIEGVLFDKSASQILIYPADKKETAFAVPDTVSVLGESVFANNTNLAHLLIPDSVTEIGKAPFADNSKITVYANEGTAGYEYAVSNSISCKPVEEFDKLQQEPVNKEALSALVDEMSNVKNLYTINSYNRFSSALGAAIDVLKDDSVDQAAVDSAFSELKLAYENLAYKTGDVDHSGILDVNDVTYIQMYISKTELKETYFDLSLADLNNSGDVSVIDATYCQMIVAGFLALDGDGKPVL